MRAESGGGADWWSLTQAALPTVRSAASGWPGAWWPGTEEGEGAREQGTALVSADPKSTTTTVQTPVKQATRNGRRLPELAAARTAWLPPAPVEASIGQVQSHLASSKMSVEADGHQPSSRAHLAPEARPATHDAAQPQAPPAASAQVTALQEELHSTKLRALRKIKEQEASLEELRSSLLMISSEKAALQAQLSQAQLAASSSAAAAPPATPVASSLNGSQTPATGAPHAVLGDDAERVRLMQHKISAQARALQGERLARQQADRAWRTTQAEAAQLREALAVAEADASEARSELRLAVRTAAQGRQQVPSGRPAPDQPYIVSPDGQGNGNARALPATPQGHAAQAQHESGELVAAVRHSSNNVDQLRGALPEAVLRQAMEEAKRAAAEEAAGAAAAAEREAAAAAEREAAAVLRAEHAEARALLQAAAAKKAEALLRDTKAKARELLEGKEKEVGALQAQLRASREGSAAAVAAGGPGVLSSEGAAAALTAPAEGANAGDHSSLQPAGAGDGRDAVLATRVTRSLLEGVDETIARDLRQHAALQASLDRERAALAQERAARAEAERRMDRSRQEMEQARAAAGAERVEGAEDEGFLRNTLIKFIEMGEEDNGALLQVLAMRLHFSAEELGRLHRLRAERAAGTGNSLASGVWAFLTPRAPSAASVARHRNAPLGVSTPSRGDAKPSARQQPASLAVTRLPPATPLPVLDMASIAEGWDAEPRGVLAASPSGRDAPVGEARSATREAWLELQRKLTVTEARLEAAERELRAAATAGRSTSLEYLRSVLVRYIAQDDGAESDALFQVIATFLQLDAPTVRRLQASRARKADAQRGMWGTLRARIAVTE